MGVGRPLTRAQFAMILRRAADPEAVAARKPAGTSNTTDMDDVESFAWCTGAVNWAVANQVINGSDNRNGTYTLASASATPPRFPSAHFSRRGVRCALSGLSLALHL